MLTERQVKFNFSWTAEIEQSLAAQYPGMQLPGIKKHSDVGNINMYVTDRQGQHHNFSDLGGAAKDDTGILFGETATGWFLFDLPRQDGNPYTFHDEDIGWSLSFFLGS